MELPPNVLAKGCPSRTVLRHLTDRWTPLIVAALADGKARFGDIRNQVEGISPKVLTETLRSMERDGLVRREVTASVPMRVDYELTELGATVITPILALQHWAQDHMDEVLEARNTYDAALV